ncbi:Coenzyme F420 hydrogenase/dehydrogenase, beta subunit C-terminal domain [Legionella jordanis]|uniref:Coenzyme F420-reducing hydrogenase subunit beta n=2 Tax=Legionella jordanis TaxID=456 RepID=A0A0W0VH02_9GAMM|nr:Coenzyme F420 hydrogenase/dehydrogenase, beta subunit C-terminal domain [Legionella jordanis]KTD19046.1 coenzyme F420-reducing hydrogenase subunit beta [Legionella jordanis]RMX05399.1 coenzyme F420 hydrogenase [Legionella jordanis]RMX19081.1 coenzyme F420 hydrogenase [Legionella jordanis]VEH13149.1 coenzyme F420-reducing hydrogenase subunit beta [Legionella jordanis]
MDMNERLSPKEMVKNGLCIGCGSCVSLAKTDKANMKFDPYGQLLPNGSKGWMQSRSELLAKICPFSPSAQNENELAERCFPETGRDCEALGHYQTAYVGYAAEEEFRLQGSSGGMVSWVASELMRQGHIDGLAHVIASGDPQKQERYFSYRISRSEKEIREGAKSRYYPVELSEVLKIIAAEEGRYAVVGIPCFIKAIQLLRQEIPLFRKRIKYTLGLFCGHMKSAKFIESFAWQLNVPVNEIQKVEFRHKDPNRPANWYNARLTLKNGTSVNRDWWHLVDGDWGAGFFMNSACNYCDDVMAETADISFGDAWIEPFTSDGKGTNVVVVRSPEVEHMIAKAIEERRLKLDPVNNGFVKETQAAGLRQRREGLAYRLARHRMKIIPRKRVKPDAKSLTTRRKLIYRMRYSISIWSHRMFWLSKKINLPKLYIYWARAVGSIYQGLTYQRGKIGEFMKWLGLD